MISCANITLERIRARLTFGSVSSVGISSGGSLVFETPDIKSFSVSKSRGSLAATFSASIQVPSTTVIPVDQDVIIEAGIKGDLKRIFTGRVLSATVNPSFERGAAYIINLAGSDRLQELEGKTISRRQRARGLSSFAAITGVTARAPQKGISFEKRLASGGFGTVVNPDTNIRENSKLVRTDRIAWDPFHPAKDPESIEDRTGDAVGESTIDIKPRSVSLSPGVSVRFNIENEIYESGDSWSVSDSSIGSIQDQQDGTAIYTQRALGENTVSFTKAGAANTFVGKSTAVGIPIHDHSSLGQGGPSFGIFSSD